MSKKHHPGKGARQAQSKGAPVANGQKDEAREGTFDWQGGPKEMILRVQNGARSARLASSGNPVDVPDALFDKWWKDAVPCPDASRRLQKAAHATRGRR